jgi:hypothetical protein
MHLQHEVVFANVVAVLFTQIEWGIGGEIADRRPVFGNYRNHEARTQSDAQPTKAFMVSARLGAAHEFLH